MEHSRIVFCDFDGTITDRETLMALFMHLLPDEAKRYGQAMFDRRMTLRQGVGGLIRELPSSRYDEIAEFSRTCGIRPGFTDFLDFLEEKGVPFVLLSGGLRVMVETILGDLIHRCHRVFALDLDRSGEYLEPVSDFVSDTELMEKSRVMAQFDYEEAVAVGDGITDIGMARTADRVFARKRLAGYLKGENLPLTVWETFPEIVSALSGHWR